MLPGNAPLQAWAKMGGCQRPESHARQLPGQSAHLRFRPETRSVEDDRYGPRLSVYLAISARSARSCVRGVMWWSYAQQHTHPHSVWGGVHG